MLNVFQGQKATAGTSMVFEEKKIAQSSRLQFGSPRIVPQALAKAKNEKRSKGSWNNK